MAFFSGRRTLLAVLLLAATSALLPTCESFSSSAACAPPSKTTKAGPSSAAPAAVAARMSPSASALAVSPSAAMADEIASSLDDDDEDGDYLLGSSDLLDDAGSPPGPGDAEALPARFASAARIAELRAAHRLHERDVGSPQYQVAGITERISHLTLHLRSNPKDFSTRRGLVALVNKRRRLLNYLYEEDEKGYGEIVAALGIRHRVPGAIPSREDQYGEFPGQKANRGKSKMKGGGKRK